MSRREALDGRQRRRAAHRASDSPAIIENYWTGAKRPLHVLVFLLPLIIAYELCLVFVLTSEQGVLTNLAHKTLLGFFEAFGIPVAGGLYLGGVLIVVVLLIWHVLLRHAWRIDLGTLGLMAFETVVLTVPLLLIAHLIAGGWEARPLMAPSTDIATLDVVSRTAISVGAGLYEELIFRMLLIAVLHTLLVDVGRASNTVGSIVAVVVAAACFTAYHPLEQADGTFAWRRASFYFVAGLYFGALFVVRGFGIVVGVHALYDVVISLSLEGPADG
jgi:hypothetical protein